MAAAPSAYKGSSSFAFVCYSHRDEKTVVEEIDTLNREGFNLWFDDAITAGKNWRSEIGESLLGSSCVLFFVSTHSLASTHCSREITLALDEGVSVVPIFLEEVDLTTEMKVGLNRVQMLKFDDASYREQILSALDFHLNQNSGPRLHTEPTPNVSRHKLGLIALSIILTSLAAGWFYWQSSHQDAPPPSITMDAQPIDHDASEASTVRIPGIAVMPFVSLTSDTEDKYFSDGISEELIQLLSRNDGLRVISRSSSFALQGRSLSLQEIGATLGVDHVLEGSVRRAGNIVRVTTSLSNVSSGANVWSESFDRPLDDVFAVQDEIASTVSARLRATLLQTDASKKRPNTQAYLAYLQARGILSLDGTEESLTEAENLLNEAIRIDPSYVSALTELGRLHLRKRQLGLVDFESSLRLSTSLIDRALDLAPGDATANAWRGWQYLTSTPQNLTAGVEYYNRALAIDGTNPEILRGLGVQLLGFGHLEDAGIVLRYVVSRDPLCVVCISNLGSYYLQTGQFDEAAAQFRVALQLSPANEAQRFGLVTSLISMHESAAALEVIEDLTPNAGTEALRILAKFTGNWSAEADAEFSAFRAQAPELLHATALLYAASGDKDRAFAVIDRWVERDGQEAAFFFLPYPPYFAEYHKDARWEEYLTRIGRDPTIYQELEFDLPLSMLETSS